MENLTSLVSICIPSYNNAKYIRETIESVLKQTFQNWELVIVDDQSTDDTVKIAQSFKDPRIRILVNDRNYGAAANFNRALREAKGKYAKLLCGDDLLYPNCLEEQLFVFESKAKDLNLALVCSRRDFVDDGGRKLFTGYGFGCSQAEISPPDALKRIVRSGTNLIGEPASVLFRTELFHKVGGFDESHSYMIDLDLWCRMLSHGPLYYLSRSLCAFRLARTSWSVRIGRSQSTQAIAFFQDLAKRRSESIRSFDLWLGCLKASFFAFFRQVIYFYLKKCR